MANYNNTRFIYITTWGPPSSSDQEYNVSTTTSIKGYSVNRFVTARGFDKPNNYTSNYILHLVLITKTLDSRLNMRPPFCLSLAHIVCETINSRVHSIMIQSATQKLIIKP